MEKKNEDQGSATVESAHANLYKAFTDTSLDARRGSTTLYGY